MRMLVIMLLLPFLGVGQCDIKKKVDKFDGSTTYQTTYARWADFYKVVKDKDTLYMVYLWTEGQTSNYYKEGAIILFKDGTKIEKPKAKIDCQLRQGANIFDYTSVITLTKNEIELFKTKPIDVFRLYIFDRPIGEKKSGKVMEAVNCLIKS